MKRLLTGVAIVAVLSLLGGCKNNGTNQNSTQMRALHAVTDAEPLDVLVDDDVKVAALALGSISPYASFNSGTRGVKIRSTSLSTILLDKQVGLGSGVNNTLAILGKRGAMSTVLLVDDTTNPSSGHFKLRATGLSPDAGTLDLYVSGGDISGTPPTMANIGYSSVTDYVEGTPGNYQFIFTTAGTKEIVFQSPVQALADGAKLTVGIFPSAGGRLVNAVLLSGTTATLISNPQTRIKAVNAVPDSPTLNFKANGTTLLSNVPFTGSSSYVATASGARTLQLEAANVPGTFIATLAKTLDPARDYTVLAVNTLAQAQLAVLTDDNSVSTLGFARVRFVNALAGSTSADVLVNFASQATGIPFKGASAYYSLATGDGYTITFATPGGVTVLASLTPVTLENTATYTAYLLGTGTAAQVKLVRDR